MSTARAPQSEHLVESGGEEHLSIERLAAYHRGQLSEPEEEAVRCHFIECAECRKTMLELVDFLEGAKRTGEWDSSRLLAAWRELRASLDAEASPEPVEEESLAR